MIDARPKHSTLQGSDPLLFEELSDVLSREFGSLRPRPHATRLRQRPEFRVGSAISGKLNQSFVSKALQELAQLFLNVVVAGVKSTQPWNERVELASGERCWKFGKKFYEVVTPRSHAGKQGLRNLNPRLPLFD